MDVELPIKLIEAGAEYAEFSSTAICLVYKEFGVHGMFYMFSI